VAYRKVYFRIQVYAYDYGYGCNSGWSNEADEAAFEQECRSLFQQLGWMLQAGSNGVCDTVVKDRQDLYLHPASFSGVMDEANIQPLQERLSKGKTFRCYAVDCYEEYADLSSEEYRAALEAKREEIIAFILEHCRTKRTNLYITDPVALHFAKHFEIPCLCDRECHNAVGNQFMSELIEQLLQEGRLASAETTHGAGIRTATARELKNYRKPVEQVPGQIAMM